MNRQLGFGVLGGFLLALIIVSACNVYSPLSSKSSTEDILEAAQKCLHEENYDCAISEYNSLPEGELKNEQLCKVYLAKAGVGLTALIDTISAQSIRMLGSLANALVPWTSERGDAAATARTHCAALATTCSNCRAGVFLKAVSLLVDCATRMAKTDQIVTSPLSTTTPCNAGGNQSGRVTQSDIENGSKFMCEADVQICNQDIVAVVAGDLAGVGYSKIASAYNLIPAGLRSADSAPFNSARGGIRSACPTN